MSLAFLRFSRINIALVAMLVIFVSGIAGYIVIEDYSIIESFYMTVITISTVGFREVKPLSEGGRLFTSFLIMVSFGTFAYALSAITSYLFSGDLRRFFQEKRLRDTVGKLENHVIICGYGRNGKRAAQEFMAHGSPFMVIEQDNEIYEDNKDNADVLIMKGDSRDDEILKRANIDRAKALISTLPDDADNLLTVLSARELNKNMLIISRASRDSTNKKLKLAGADNVIMPDKIGGAHMASLVLKPDVVEFLDHIFVQNPEAPFLSEVMCSDLSKDDQTYTIGKLKEVSTSGVVILGTKSPEGKFIINPPDSYNLEPNSKLFVLGTSEQIQSF